jgi:hypothetical protein
MRRLPLALLLLAGTIGRAEAFDQGGSIKAWGDAYETGDPGRQGWFRATYVLDAQPRPWLFVKIAAIVEGDSHGEIRRDRLYEDADRGLKRAAMRFRDLAIGLRARDTTVVIGRQRLTWGRTTFLNATDNLTARDWTDPLDEVRLSPWSVDAVWERGRWSVEGALVPRFTPSRLPQLGSRWLPADPAIDLSFGDARFPAVTWSTMQLGLRGGYRGASAEGTLSYFRGYDDAPRIVPTLSTLDRRFAKLEVAGVDGEVLIGAFALRGEGGYFHFPEGLDEGYGLFQVEAEWSHAPWRVIVGYGDAIGGATRIAATSLDHAFLPALFFYLSRGEPTEWEVALDATVGTKEFDSRVKLSGSYPFEGHARIGGEVDVLSGGASTFWGRWRDNDRLRLFVKFDF